MSSVAKENKMGWVSIPKLLITISLPMMLSMLVQALYNVVDSLFIAQLGAVGGPQNELTAINLSFPAQNLMIAFAVGTGVGVNALASRNLGMGEPERAKKIAGNGVFLLAVTYVVFALLGVFAVRPFFEMQTDNREVIELGVSYLSICYIMSFGLFFQVAFEKCMQATGKTMLSMVVQLVGAITNIIFDPILIFGLFGFPKLGVAGAAVATVGGQMLSMIVGFFLNQKKNPELKLAARHVVPNGKAIADIYKIGLPSVLMNSVGSIMTAGINMIISGINQVAVNAFGIYFKLQSFVFMPVFGLNNGLISIAAYNYGAKKRSRLTSAIRFAILYAAGYMLLGFAVFQLFPESLLSMFNASPELLAIGVPALKTMSICFVFASFSVIMTSTFQALGRSLFSMLISIARQLLVLLPAAYLLSLTGNIDNVWWAFPIAELTCVLCCVAFFKYIYDKVICRLPREKM